MDSKVRQRVGGPLKPNRGNQDGAIRMLQESVKKLFIRRDEFRDLLGAVQRFHLAEPATDHVGADTAQLLIPIAEVQRSLLAIDRIRLPGHVAETESAIQVRSG